MKTLKIILTLITITAMLGIFKLFFASDSDSGLSEKINGKTFLVDVRSPQEFASGSVKGAVNIPLDRVQSELSKFRDKENIVVFCRTGNRSGQAKTILEKNGITNVINGGSWQNVNQFVNN